MILYGAGGQAKVIISIINTTGGDVKGIFDDDHRKKTLNDIPVIHQYSAELFADEPMIIAVGNNQIRRRISGDILHSFGNVIHPSAIIAPDVIVGTGITVMHHAVIQAGSVISDHVIVNTASVIEHDCRIENFVHVAPGAILCGNVRIGENTLIGAGASVVPNVSIGKNCVIGAGTIVLFDIPDCATVCGNPGRIIKFNHTL